MNQIFDKVVVAQTYLLELLFFQARRGLLGRSVGQDLAT